MLDLARIERNGALGLQDIKVRKHDPADVADLRAMYHRIPADSFARFQHGWLNPEFGEASAMVGGARADLILDDTLIDIKTWSKPVLDANAWGQLVGYTLLADLARSAGAAWPRITKVAIYWSRHGRLQTWTLAGFYRPPAYERFRDWFRDHAQALYGPAAIGREARRPEATRLLIRKVPI